MSEHRSFPKPTPRLQDRVAQQREAMRAWLECCRVVDARDKWLCRCCGRKTRKTLTVCPERLEHHHLVPRSRARHRIADPSNVITLCLSCHQRVTRHEISIVGENANGLLGVIE